MKISSTSSKDVQGKMTNSYGPSILQQRHRDFDTTTVRAYYVVRDPDHGCMCHVTTKHFSDKSPPSVHVWLCADCDTPDNFECQECDPPALFEVEFFPGEYLSSRPFIIYCNQDNPYLATSRFFLCKHLVQSFKLVPPELFLEVQS